MIRFFLNKNNDDTNHIREDRSPLTTKNPIPGCLGLPHFYKGISQDTSISSKQILDQGPTL